MPLTTLYVASASILTGKEWSDESEIVGEANEVSASYKANGADAASLSLIFDTAEIPTDAEIGEVFVLLQGAWSGPGSPQDVVLTLAGGPALTYVLGAPDAYENVDAAGWGMTASAFNALEATLELTTLDAETYDFDAVQVKVNWTEPESPPDPVRPRGGGMLGGGSLAGFGGL